MTICATTSSHPPVSTTRLLAASRLPTRAELRATNAGVPRGSALPTDGRGCPARLADLPDPFDPLLELFSLGYGVRASPRVPFQLVAPLG